MAYKSNVFGICIRVLYEKKTPEIYYNVYIWPRTNNVPNISYNTFIKLEGNDDVNPNNSWGKGLKDYLFSRVYNLESNFHIIDFGNYMGKKEDSCLKPVLLCKKIHLRDGW